MAEWGSHTDQSTDINLSTPRAMGGLFNPGSNGTLNSIHFVMVDSGHDVRVAIYESDSIDIDNATLLEDLGVVATSGTENVATSITNPTLTNGKYYHLAFKTDSVDRADYTGGSAPMGDFSRYNSLANETNTPSDAWDDPCTADTFNAADRCIQCWIDYTAAGGGSTVSNLPRLLALDII